MCCSPFCFPTRPLLQQQQKLPQQQESQHCPMHQRVIFCCCLGHSGSLVTAAAAATAAEATAAAAAVKILKVRSQQQRDCAKDLLPSTVEDDVISQQPKSHRGLICSIWFSLSLSFSLFVTFTFFVKDLLSSTVEDDVISQQPKSHRGLICSIWFSLSLFCCFPLFVAFTFTFLFLHFCKRSAAFHGE